MNQSARVTLRPATSADADLLLAWRNDPETRAASRNTVSVEADEHVRWLSRMLDSRDYVMQIAEVDGKPVGVVRADRTPQGWELSWTVAPVARGQGFGARMLEHFAASLEGRLTAVIRNDNLASEKIAAVAGFAAAGDAPDPNFRLWVRT